MKTCIVLSILLITNECSGKFPPWFKFGAATSSFQIEGAWNISDKTPCIWDTYCHIKDDVKCSNANGDVTANSYYQWEEDLDAAADIGLDYYRFSISWTRILPSGYPNKISKDGLRYYNELINGLLARGIEPMVTMYHWELPQNLQDLGGWTNALISTWFADYAKVLFSLFGDRVKTWLTINEPLIMCAAAYSENTKFAPGISDANYGAYLCAKNTLLAHAHAWRIYDAMFKPKYHGKVGIANQIFWIEGRSEEERKLGELTYMLNAIYTYPVFSKNGGWPAEIENIIATNSKNEGFSFSRLPPLTIDEISLVKGTYDFFGLNYYSSRVARKATKDDKLEWPFMGSQELGSFLTIDDTWRKADSLSWLYEYPIGLRRILEWVKKEFGDIEIIITEIGYGDSGLDEKDYKKIRYHKEHLEQVDLAIKAGINVTGYTAWSLIDTFEWESGNTVKFGLYKVDYDDPKRLRVARQSAKYFAAVIQAKSFDVLHKYIYDELYCIFYFLIAKHL